VKCWNCGTENDLDRVQTCAHCGAPLVETRAFFGKPWLLVVVSVGMVLYGLFVLWMCRFRGR